MDATVQVNTKVSPKSLPMKYKAMLFASISFINTNVTDLVLREELFSKLPIHKTVEEQIAYFDEVADLKKIEQTIYKPMLKEHKKQEKITNKPVKEKKASIKKKKVDVAKDEEVTKAEVKDTPEEKELEFETEYPNANATANVLTEEGGEKLETKELEVVKAKKPVVPRKKKEQTKNEEVAVITSENSEQKAPVKAPKAPRKKKEEKVKEIVVVSVVEADDFYMIPPSVIPEGKYWTKDENYRNGPIYANGKDQDGDSAPSEIVGKLEDGKVIFEGEL